MTENEYLEMPWSIEDTIENLKTIKEHLIATVLKTNLDGKGKQDAKEVEFDFNRAIQALEKVQQYEAIGTIEECKMAMGKVFVKKRTILHGNYYCCECGKLAEKSGHCNFCGQSLY